MTLRYHRHTFPDQVRWKRCLISPETWPGGSFPEKKVQRGGLTWVWGWTWIPPWTRCPEGRNPPSQTPGSRARPWCDPGAHFTTRTAACEAPTGALTSAEVPLVSGRPNARCASAVLRKSQTVNPGIFNMQALWTLLGTINGCICKCMLLSFL